MKEKIAKVMRSGGYAVIIATVAMAAYLAVLRWGDKFIKNQAVPLEISVDENGYLSTNYGGDTDGIYILWQTDGGNIQPVEKNEKLSEQYEEGNKWYFAYTAPKEKVKWGSEDADGNNYTEVTVRATIYKTSSSQTVFYIGDYINEASITIKKENDKTVKTDDRLFSNPVREGESNWSQIYQISSDIYETKTYMYRTGYEIDKPENKILVWEADQSILNITDLRGGTVKGFTVDAENSGKSIICAASLITYNPKNIKDELNLKAYLTYSDNSEKKYGEISVEEQFYKSEISINVNNSK